MTKSIKITFLLMAIFLLTGCAAGKKETKNQTQSANQNTGQEEARVSSEDLSRLGDYERNLLKCLENLSSMHQKDKDNCFDVSASVTMKHIYCKKIADTTRQSFCYMSLAKQKNDPPLCDNIADSKLRKGCSLYLMEVNTSGNPEKEILLKHIDGNISKLITDIKTLFAQKGETSKDKIQQKINELEELTQKRALVEQGAVNLDNF